MYTNSISSMFTWTIIVNYVRLSCNEIKVELFIYFILLLSVL